MVERLTITALGHEGDGIAETAAGRVFVPFTLPGEIVTAEVDGERGRLIDILEPSPERIAPVSKYYGVCGGCSVQHWQAEPYRAWKRELVVAAFAQRGIEADVELLVAIAPHTRRRAVFTLIKTDDGTILGFNKRESHAVLSIDACPLLVPAIERRLEKLRTVAIRLLERGKRARMTVTATDSGLDVVLEGGRKPNRNDFEALGREAAESAIVRLTVDGTEIYMTRLPEIRTDDSVLFPTPGGFLQATAPSEAALAALVDEAVADVSASKGAQVADLFSGIGTFTLRLARRFPMLAVESAPELLIALERAARFSKGIRTITTRRRDLFLNPMAPPELKPFKAVVFDPPRAGAKAQVEMLAKSAVPVVVGVSCNPATLARDARILIDGGYRLTRVTPVDQFLWSGHVEVVAAFEKG